LEARLRLLPWLWADADLALAHAEFVSNGGNGGAVALAPRVAYTGGLTARHPRGWKAALRVRGGRSRPIIDPQDQALFTAAGQPVPVDQSANAASRRSRMRARAPTSPSYARGMTLPVTPVTARRASFEWKPLP